MYLCQVSHWFVKMIRIWQCPPLFDDPALPQWVGNGHRNLVLNRLRSYIIKRLEYQKLPTLLELVSVLDCLRKKIYYCIIYAYMHKSHIPVSFFLTSSLNNLLFTILKITPLSRLDWTLLWTRKAGNTGSAPIPYFLEARLKSTSWDASAVGVGVM